MKRSFALFSGVATVHWIAVTLIIGVHCALGTLLFCSPNESIGWLPYVGLAVFSAGVTILVFVPIWHVLTRLNRVSVMSILVFWFIGGVGVPLLAAFAIAGQAFFRSNPFLEIQLLTLSGAAAFSSIFFCLQLRKP